MYYAASLKLSMYLTVIHLNFTQYNSMCDRRIFPNVHTQTLCNNNTRHICTPHKNAVTTA